MNYPSKPEEWLFAMIIGIGWLVFAGAWYTGIRLYIDNVGVAILVSILCVPIAFVIVGFFGVIGGNLIAVAEGWFLDE